MVEWMIVPYLMCYFTILLNDIIDLHMCSLDDIIDLHMCSLDDIIDLHTCSLRTLMYVLCNKTLSLLMSGT